MLDKFKKYGQRAGYFRIKRIGDFKGSEKEGFAHINTKAIDFDETTKTLCQEQGQNAIKSCDAVDIMVSENRINLIEFKQFDREEVRKDYIRRLELPQKVKDSMSTLLNILRKKEMIHRDKVKTFGSCEKNAIISFNLPRDPEEKLSLLFRTETITQKTATEMMIEAEFEEDRILELKNVQCIRMEDFDEVYSKFNRAA